MALLVIAPAVASATQQHLHVALSVTDANGLPVDDLHAGRDGVDAFIASATFDESQRPYFVPLVVRGLWPTSVAGVHHLFLAPADLTGVPDAGPNVLVVTVRKGEDEGRSIVSCTVR